jgi:hypothetical protein
LLGQGQGQGQVFVSALPKGETIWPLSQIVLPPLFEKLRGGGGSRTIQNQKQKTKAIRALTPTSAIIPQPYQIPLKPSDTVWYRSIPHVHGTYMAPSLGIEGPIWTMNFGKPLLLVPFVSKGHFTFVAP